jgi:hypothetical protein
VIVVGEWMGDTGDASFTAALLEDFNLVLRVQLPNWSDTAHELTVWERKLKAARGKQKKKRKRDIQVRTMGVCLEKPNFNHTY